MTFYFAKVGKLRFRVIVMVSMVMVCCTYWLHQSVTLVYLVMVVDKLMMH